MYIQSRAVMSRVVTIRRVIEMYSVRGRAKRMEYLLNPTRTSLDSGEIQVYLINRSENVRLSGPGCMEPSPIECTRLSLNGRASPRIRSQTGLINKEKEKKERTKKGEINKINK